MVQIQIAHGRRVRGYSVQLDASTKSKIRHYLEKIREIIDRLEVHFPKKKRLQRKSPRFPTKWTETERALMPMQHWRLRWRRQAEK